MSYLISIWIFIGNPPIVSDEVVQGQSEEEIAHHNTEHPSKNDKVRLIDFLHFLLFTYLTLNTSAKSRHAQLKKVITKFKPCIESFIHKVLKSEIS